MKKLAFSFLMLAAFSCYSADYEEEDEYLVYKDEEYDTDDDYYLTKGYEEEDEYLASCAGGKCPREMVERLRREKQEQRARLGEENYEEDGFEATPENQTGERPKEELRKKPYQKNGTLA